MAQKKHNGVCYCKKYSSQKNWNVFRIGQVKVEEKPSLYPAIERLDDRIVRERTPRDMKHNIL